MLTPTDQGMMNIRDMALKAGILTKPIELRDFLDRSFIPTDIKPADITVPEDVNLLIPMKVISDSDLIPVTGSEVKLIVFGAKRRWRSYRA